MKEIKEKNNNNNDDDNVNVNNNTRKRELFYSVRSLIKRDTWSKGYLYISKDTHTHKYI